MNGAMLKQALSTGVQLARGTIGKRRMDGLLEVEVAGDDKRTLVCQVLLTGDSGSAALAAGDEVLLALLPGPGSDGVVLGKVGFLDADPSLSPPTEQPEEDEREESRTIKATEIILEADRELVLRCGAGMIRVQRDGKVIIRGENVLSAARGVNRIKGGSVGIN